jgi:hypothetical protein
MEKETLLPIRLIRLRISRLIMKNRLAPGLLALLLVLGCALLRLLGNLRPDLLPGFTPCVALAFVGAAYLPRRWSWLLGAAAILLSELAFLRWNFLSEGRWLSPMVLISLGFYLLMGGLGILLPRRPSLGLLFGGPLAGSLLFYLATNTFSWWSSSAGSPLYAYPQNWAGWVQANTTGWPGYPPTWLFLRNGLLADLLFTAALIAIFDPTRLALAAGPRKAGARI